MNATRVGDGKTIVVPEGTTGKQVKKVVIPQTSERARKLNPEIPKKEEEKAAPAKSSVIAKAKAAKADKAPTAQKKSKEAGKYAHNITSMEKLGDYCLENKLSEKETEKLFKEGYALKGQTDMTFIKPRIAIYMNIAKKRAAKLAEKEKAAAKKTEHKKPEPAK